MAGGTRHRNPSFDEGSLQLKVKQKRKIQSDDRQQSQAAGGNKRIESRVFTVGAEDRTSRISAQQGWIYLAVIIGSPRGRLVN